MRIIRLIVASFSVLLFVGCASIERLAIPKAKLKNDQLAQFGNASEPDHSAWDRFLKTYLVTTEDDIGRLAYRFVSDADKASLDGYLNEMSQVTASELDRDAQLAYWSNIYNALTVQVILENYPVDSIRDITNGLLDIGPWEDKRIVINGEELSLHDIEHGIIRSVWSDVPEIHYLVNCAAVGCPSLVSYAFTASNINRALAKNAEAFINSTQGVDVNENGRLVLSKIFAWYLSDFGGTKETVFEHLLQYANAETRLKIQEHGKRVKYVYDWSLNESVIDPFSPDS